MKKSELPGLPVESDLCVASASTTPQFSLLSSLTRHTLGHQGDIEEVSCT